MIDNIEGISRVLLLLRIFGKESSTRKSRVGIPFWKVGDDEVVLGPASFQTLDR